MSDKHSRPNDGPPDNSASLLIASLIVALCLAGYLIFFDTSQSDIDAQDAVQTEPPTEIDKP